MNDAAGTTSKKFLENIGSQSNVNLATTNDCISTEYEIYDESGNNATEDTDESKECSNRFTVKSQIEDAPKKTQRAKSKRAKRQLKRGMTVKFNNGQSKKDKLSEFQVQYTQRMVNFCKSKSQKRIKSKERVTSNDGRYEKVNSLSKNMTKIEVRDSNVKSTNSSVIESNLIIHPVTNIHNRKYKPKSNKKELSGGYKLDNYFTQNCTPNPKSD